MSAAVQSVVALMTREGMEVTGEEEAVRRLSVKELQGMEGRSDVAGL